MAYLNLTLLNFISEKKKRLNPTKDQWKNQGQKEESRDLVTWHISKK